MTAIGATAVGVTAVRNDLKLWTIINVGSTIILWWSLFFHNIPPPHLELFLSSFQNWKVWTSLSLTSSYILKPGFRLWLPGMLWHYWQFPISGPTDPPPPFWTMSKSKQIFSRYSFPYQSSPLVCASSGQTWSRWKVLTVLKENVHDCIKTSTSSRLDTRSGTNSVFMETGSRPIMYNLGQFTMG